MVYIFPCLKRLQVILTFPESWKSEGMAGMQELKGNKESNYLCFFAFYCLNPLPGI